MSEKLKRDAVIKVEIITMPTFIKLLAINMVANKRSGIFNSLIIILLALDSFFSILPFIEGLSEKKATSDPEIKAENISRTIITNMATRSPNETGLKVISSLVSNTWE